MEKRGYKREIECVECPKCPPMEHSHLKQYFSSHHYFKPENNNCPLTFLEAFEYLCKQGKDFTFFLDSHHFPKDKLYYIEDLIKIGKKYGEFSLLSN